MIPQLSPLELEIKMADENEMAYTSKQHEKIMPYVIFFVLKGKTESIFRLP